MQIYDAKQKFNSVVYELEKIKADAKEHVEGGCLGDQAADFIQFLQKNPQITRVLEIGFNVGNSCAAFLSANPEIKVISVDLGEHKYIYDSKKIIDKHFPNRHQLFIGDSLKLIPELKGKIYPDFIFIDGGHYDDIPLKDIRNCLALSDNNTILCLDDTEFMWFDIRIALCTVLKSKEIDQESVLEIKVPNNGKSWTYFKKTPQ
jgi:predicted O-methyltransferase YrrM